MHNTMSTRLWAAAAALALNLALFALMPHLQRPQAHHAVTDDPLANINVIRIKRPDSPIKPKAEKPPEPPKPLEKPKPEEMRPKVARLRLPFKVNPRLPQALSNLVLPDFEPAAFDTGNLSDAFSAGDLDAPLTILVRVPPIYPMQAKRRGIEGWVRVGFVVNEDGSVGRVTIVESQPPDIFDRSVIRCVTGWRFKPGTVAGMPVKAAAETTVTFKVK